VVVELGIVVDPKGKGKEEVGVVVVLVVGVMGGFLLAFEEELQELFLYHPQIVQV